MPKTHDLRPTTRIGYGFDCSRISAFGIPLKIGGIALAHDKGLGGHSDGDVLLHAITDALLGAVAAPDIGALFPPSDPKWKGADSVVFLREALNRVRDAGYAVANIDSSLILAAPKIGPHAATIRMRVAQLLGIHVNCVRAEGKNSRRIEFGKYGDRARGSAAGSKWRRGKVAKEKRFKEKVALQEKPKAGPKRAAVKLKCAAPQPPQSAPQRWPAKPHPARPTALDAIAPLQ